MSTTQPAPLRPRDILGIAMVVITILAVLLAAIFGIIAGAHAFGRYQARANAHNKVKITNTQIATTAQQVQIAKQQAEIRVQNAIGIRQAQDEISKTLTPLYVQFEMVQALQQIAESGRNSSVIYIPTGANGIPLISSSNQSQVGMPDTSK